MQFNVLGLLQALAFTGSSLYLGSRFSDHFLGNVLYSCPGWGFVEDSLFSVHRSINFSSPTGCSEAGFVMGSYFSLVSTT